jgi:hypothetical protein
MSRGIDGAKVKTMNLTSEQQQAIDRGEAVTFTVDGRECVLVRKDVYERVREIIPDDIPSIDEQLYMLRQIGEMAGWDDPEMDVYDEPSP